MSEYKIYKNTNPDYRNEIFEAFQYDGTEESFKDIKSEYYPLEVVKEEDGTVVVPELDKKYENGYKIKPGDYIFFYTSKNEDGQYVFNTTWFPKKEFEEKFELCTGTEEIILTEETMKQISEIGDLFGCDLGLPVTKESKPDFFEKYGPCLLSIGFTKEAGAIFTADGTYKFIFDYDKQNVGLVNLKKEKETEK